MTIVQHCILALASVSTLFVLWLLSVGGLGVSDPEAATLALAVACVSWLCWVIVMCTRQGLAAIAANSRRTLDLRREVKELRDLMESRPEFAAAFARRAWQKHLKVVDD